jgi:hypothetical protein
MDFEAALAFLKAFSAFNPRIYKEFPGFPEENCREVERGYVLFVDPSAAKKDSFCALEGYAKTKNLHITPYREVLMISGPTKKH